MSQICHTVLAQPTQPWDFVPLPNAVGNRYVIDRRDLEDFKLRLKGLPPDDAPRGPIVNVSIGQAATEIGCHVKSLKKWVRLRLMREAGKPTPVPERTSTIVKRNRQPIAKRSTRALETA